MMERSLHSHTPTHAQYSANIHVPCPQPGWSINPHPLDFGLDHVTCFDPYGSLPVLRRDSNGPWVCTLPVSCSYLSSLKNNMPQGAITPTAWVSKWMTHRADLNLTWGLESSLVKSSGVQPSSSETRWASADLLSHDEKLMFVFISH